MNILIRSNNVWQVIIHIGIAVFLFLLMGILFFYWYLPSSTHHNQTVVVPKIVGISVEQLDKKLQEEGFEIIVVDSNYSRDFKPFTVLTQYPEANDKVKRGRKLYVTVSPKYPPIIKMTELKGISYPIAMQKLRALNLELGEMQFRSHVAVDVVLEQRVNGKVIAKGDAIRTGSKVDLVVGKGVGEQEFNVPHLEGMTLDNAKKVLYSYDLQIGVIKYDATAKAPNGIIFRQAPEYMMRAAKIEEEVGKNGKLKMKSQTDESGESPAKMQQNITNKIRAGEIIDLWISTNKNYSTELKKNE
jgi:eukaryotic-like serine/threonine-protein kinase